MGTPVRIPQDLNEIGGALADDDTIAVVDVSDVSVSPAGRMRNALLSRIYDYIRSKFPFAEGAWPTPPVFSGHVGFTVSETLQTHFYKQQGDLVEAFVRVTITRTTTTAKELQITLPVARTGAFSDGNKAGGLVTTNSATGLAGRVVSETGTQRVKVMIDDSATSGSVTLYINFWYSRT